VVSFNLRVILGQSSEGNLFHLWWNYEDIIDLNCVTKGKWIISEIMTKKKMADERNTGFNEKNKLTY